MGKIIRNGIKYSGTYDDATSVNYDNSISGLNARTVQEGIDELSESVIADDGLQFKFSNDGEGNYGFLGADGSFIPFKSGGGKVAYEINVVDKNKTVFDLGFKPQILIFARSGNSSNSSLTCVYDETVSTTQCWYYVQGSNPALRNLGDRIASIDENGFTIASVMALYAYSYIAISGLNDNRIKSLIPVMTSDTAPSGKVTYSKQSSSNYAYRAFDSTTSTTWTADGADNYVCYEFPCEVELKEISFTTYAGSAGSGNPHNARFYTSLTGNDEDWKLIATEYVDSNYNSQRNIVLETTEKTKYIKYYPDANTMTASGTKYVTLTDLQCYGIKLAFK